MDRSFSEDQARAIFARAAERQHATEMRGEGLTLAELQEIGQAAGLDPAHVNAAVREVTNGGIETEHVAVWGVDVTPRATRVLPGPLTDQAWAQMIGRARATFETTGVASTIGATREWRGTNEQGAVSTLQLTAEPTDGGTRLTLESSRAKEARDIRRTPAYAAVAAVALAVFLAVGDFPAHYPFLIPALILAANLLMGVGLRAHLARWSRTHQGQFGGLMDQFELIALGAPSGSQAPRPVAPLAALLDEPDVQAGGDTHGDEAPAPQRARP